ncbi:MAG: nitroreductase family protein [Opitutales bacterium]
MNVNYKILSVALIICIAFLLFRVNTDVPSADVVLNNIHTRTSVREYSDKKVSEEILTTLVKAAMAAPTAGNMQPWNFLVLQDKEELEKISQIHTYTKPLGGARAAIVVTGDMSTYENRQDFSKFWLTDGSVATQNILLAAHSLGLGAVWLSVYPSEERDSKLREVIKVPENTNILCIVSLGYPARDFVPKNKWKPEKLSFDKFD